MRLFSKYCQLGVLLLITGPFALAETDTVSPKAASAMQGEDKAVIVDVREDDEWNAHHIPGAIHIPLGQLNERLAELEPYKNRPVITQCQSGLRSAKAQLTLNSAGFSKVYSMDGGIQAWDEQGLATE
ncbi:rhodanese-like domain-containing protein [Methylobacter sp. G7]|uniref:rhodanese-like domain-containing protein n=1 Tax=Methylobacter sp. G7 TaxID=3230117 RepID=UPI003D800694